jgi:alginate O-acetyltransferase complex protein AlgI
MLFNSYLFLFAFLPMAVLGFYAASSLHRRAGTFWLIIISFVFYGWWNPAFVLLLMASILFNYTVSEIIGRLENRPSLQRAALAFGIAANLLVLVYYKYFVSLMHFASTLGLTTTHLPAIVLPLGISFFTFTQIGYIVDVQQGAAKDRGFLSYVLFVTFFPHLIAGPILHNREIMPQFSKESTYRFSMETFVFGLCIFVIGLGKKCVFADSLSDIVAPGFQATDHLGLWSAWNVLLSYSLQLYFDFSGYTDMAIGIAWMFNIRFPLNFNSPHKATNIIDYWQRWHMTLTRYLTLYLYNPIALIITRWRVARGLGITRTTQRTPGGFAAMVALPTLVTMGLAGIWHGAGLQYLIFGLLHGCYLTINHAWRLFRRGHTAQPDSRPVRIGKRLLTFLAVLVALDFFRAPSVGAAVTLLGGLVGLQGLGAIPMPPFLIAHLGGLGQMLAARGLAVNVGGAGFVSAMAQLSWLVILYCIVWLLPNTQQIMQSASPVINETRSGLAGWLTWRPSRSWALVLGLAATTGVMAIGGTSEFLYFKF